MVVYFERKIQCKERGKIMLYIYKIFGKLSIVFYIFMLYQLWHLCQYGGLHSHFPKIVVGMCAFVVTFLLWLITRAYYKKATSENTTKKKIFYIEIVGILLVTLFFGGRIVYSAIPYHGALSWKVDEWINKKEIPLEHNNLYKTGVEGILEDLNEKLDLLEKLYISNKCQITFDKNGTIHDISAFLYGKDEGGKKNTYLIEYDAENSDFITVWTDSDEDSEYEEDMSLSPMMEILKKADWVEQVKKWAENEEESQLYEILYMGRRAFNSEAGLQYIPKDADSVQTGNHYFEQLRTGGEILGFEVSLHIPEVQSITPVRYIMDPQYISQEKLDQENTAQQVEEAKNTERWIVDQSDGAMYFSFGEQNVWRLVVVDAAAGSRFYVMEKSVDKGAVWERINENPFLGQAGVAQGMVFFDEKFGVIGLTGASQSYSTLYVTRDGGTSFEKIEFPMSGITELPKRAQECGFTVADYDYFCMPEKDENMLTITVTTAANESDGIVFQSTDNGNSWEYKGVTE